MYEDEGFQLMGAAFEVHNHLGYGMAEEVYQQCLEVELGLRGIPYAEKKELELVYKGQLIDKKYIPDLFAYDAIVVEIKAVKELIPDHAAQLFNYMRISERPVGYLLNFGAKEKLEWKRFILTDLRRRD